MFLIHSGGGGLRDLGGAYNIFVDFGKYGVPMFFVISGFTIFYQLSSGRYTYKKFLLVRISRISIPYFPLIILCLLYIELGGEQFNYWAIKFNNGYISVENLIAHFTYLASFNLKYTNTIIGIEWSLHIEVFFYCVLGYLITHRLLQLRFNSLLNAFCVSMLIWLLFQHLAHPSRLGYLFVHWMPFKYAWMFVLGGFGYYFRNVVSIKLAKRAQSYLSNISVILCFLSILYLLNINTINNMGNINEGVFAALTFLLIVFVRDTAFLSVLLNNKILIWYGSLSFSFYLLHYIVIRLPIANIFTNNDVLLFTIDFMITALIAQIWFIVFEVKLYRAVKQWINGLTSVSIA